MKLLFLPALRMPSRICTAGKGLLLIFAGMGEKKLSSATSTNITVCGQQHPEEQCSLGILGIGLFVGFSPGNGN